MNMGGYMAKKGFILMITIIVFVTTTSCYAYKHRHALDEDLHGQTEEFFYEEDDEYFCLIYKGIVYKNVEDSRFLGMSFTDLYHTEDFVMISWEGYRYIFYLNEYYSYTRDNPLYIYESRMQQLYFREDYNIYTDTFIVEETGREIVLQDIFASESKEIVFDNSAKKVDVFLSLKRSEHIKVKVELIFYNNVWHITFYDTTDVWIASTEFIEAVYSADLT